RVLFRSALDAGKKALQAGPLAVQLGGASTDVVLPHQPLDATPPHGLALQAQGGMHTRAAVGPAAVPVDAADLLQQWLILQCALAGQSTNPRVITRSADTIKAAHHLHRAGFLVVLDEGEDLALRPEVNAMAFFKRSCSSLSCSYFRCISRSCLSSAAIALSTSTPLVTICPSRASFRQRGSRKGWM